MNSQDQQRIKNNQMAVINSIMSNPNLSRTIHESASAPIGSTKRDKAKSIISILNKTNPAGRFSGQGGPGYDGQGGWGDIGNFIGSMGSGIVGAARGIFAPSAGTPISGTPGAPIPASAGDVGNAIGSIPRRLGDAGGAVQDWNYNTANNVSNYISNATSDFTSGVSAGFNGQPESVHVFPPTPTMKTNSGTGSLAQNITTANSNMNPEGDALVANMTPTGPQNIVTSTPHSNLSTETPVVVDDKNTTKTSSGAVAGDNPSSTASTNTKTKTDASNNPGSITSGSSTGAAHDIALKIPGLTNITLPASQVITEFGLRNVWDAFKQNEGSSPKGVENNPGNIKFAGLPGQIDSGIHPTDDPKGTFASYSTPQEGDQAGMGLLMSAASGQISAYGQNPTFEQLANTYTNTGQGSSSSGDSSTSNSGMTGGGGDTPIINSDGIVNTAAAMAAATVALGSNMGPDAFAQAALGATASSQLPELQNKLKETYGLNDTLAKLTKLQQMGPTLNTDLVDYVKNRDTYVSEIDGMISKADNIMATTDVSGNYDQIINYKNFLLGLRGQQNQLYGEYIQRGIDRYNSDVSSLTNQYQNALTAYNSTLTMDEKMMTDTYNNNYKTLSNMYTTLQDAPHKSAQAIKDAAAIQKLNLSTVGSLVGNVDFLKDGMPEVLKQPNFIQVDPATNKITLDSKADLPSVVQTLLNSSPDNNLAVSRAQAAVYAYVQGKHSELGGMIGHAESTDSNGVVTPATPAKAGLFKATKDAEISVENAIGTLTPDQQAAMSKSKNDAQSTILKDLKVGTENYIKENYNNVFKAIEELSGRTERTFVGKVIHLGLGSSKNVSTPTDVKQFIKDNPNVDPDLLTAIFNATQLMKDTQPDWTPVQGFNNAIIPGQKVDVHNPIATMIDGTPINDPSLTKQEKLAGYLSDQIAKPFQYLQGENIGFNGSSPYPKTPLDLGAGEAGAPASAFEGHLAYSGNPTVNGLLNSSVDNGPSTLNPKGEPIYGRTTFPQTESDAIKQKLLNQDPYWAQHNIGMNGVQLDHIWPIEAGGPPKDPNNWALMETGSDKNNQIFEDNLAYYYQSGQISRADAAQASIDYKVNLKVTPLIQQIMSGKK